MSTNSRVRLVPVRELGEVRMGKQLSPDSRASGRQFPYLRVANVLDGCIDYSDVKTMGFSETERNVYSLRPGDILLNEGQSLELVGRSAIYDQPEGAFCFQNTLVRFRAGEEVLPKYAQAVFNRWLSTGVFASIAKKTTSIAHLGGDRFGALRFPLLPLAEQQRIVEVLGSLTEAERFIEAMIAKLGALRSGVLEELATREQITLGEVLSSGPQNGLYKPGSAYGPEGVPIVRINSFAGGPSDLTRDLLRIDASSRETALYGLNHGDILINRVNTPELVGKSTAALEFEEPTVFESNVMRCELSRGKALPIFAEAWLGTTTAKAYFLRRAKSAVSQASINQNDVLSCPFPDMDLAEQQKFLRRLSAVNARQMEEVDALIKLRKMKQGLADDLLTGRVQVRQLT